MNCIICNTSMVRDEFNNDNYTEICSKGHYIIEIVDGKKDYESIWNGKLSSNVISFFYNKNRTEIDDQSEFNNPIVYNFIPKIDYKNIQNTIDRLLNIIVFI